MSFKGLKNTNKSFLLFVTSQAISTLGDTFQFIAVTTLLFKITGSGLAAGFSLICSPIISIILSSLAGSLGDRLPSKNLLIVVDLLRGITAALFAFSHDRWNVYFLLVLLSLLNVLYNPPGRKLIVNLLSKKELIMGNSYLSGICGLAYLFGPVLAGFVVGGMGVNIAFIINSISFLFSAILIGFIAERVSNSAFIKKTGLHKYSLLTDIKCSFAYFMKSYPIKEMFVVTTVISSVIAAMNLAFYPFAFDVLKVTSQGWGVMMSVFYGTNLFAMLIFLIFEKRINKAMIFFIYFPLIIISFVWFAYGMTEKLILVLLLQAIEGTALSVCGILLGTRLQIITKKSFLARISGINDILNNTGRLFGIGCTYILLIFFPPAFIFFINSLILLGYSTYKLITLQTSIKKYNKNIEI